MILSDISAYLEKWGKTKSTPGSPLRLAASDSLQALVMGMAE
jgi:hypothetical protein